MTNHPRYSPPPQQPGYHPVPDRRGPPGYSGRGQQQTYPQQFDWRYGQQPPYRQPYGSFGGGQAGPAGGPPPPQPGETRKAFAPGAMAAGRIGVAWVWGGT